MESKRPTQIGLRLAVTLQPSQDGSSQHQELGLVWGSPESLRQNIHSFGGLFQPIQQTGEMEPALDVSRLQFEQLAIRSDRRTGQRAGRQIVRLLEPPLRLAPVPRRRGAGVRRSGHCPERWRLG
jgi:hypothetical protein